MKAFFPLSQCLPILIKPVGCFFSEIIITLCALNQTPTIWIQLAAARTEQQLVRSGLGGGRGHAEKIPTLPLFHIAAVAFNIPTNIPILVTPVYLYDSIFASLSGLLLLKYCLSDVNQQPINQYNAKYSRSKAFAKMSLKWITIAKWF